MQNIHEKNHHSYNINMHCHNYEWRHRWKDFTVLIICHNPIFIYENYGTPYIIEEYILSHTFI